MPRPALLKIYCDGGARPNPGPIELAVVARGVAHFFDDRGDGSSSDAEWLALIAAIELARELGARHFDLLGDNRHVIDRGTDLLKGGLASPGHEQRFAALAAEWPPRRLRWLPRQQNLAGIALDHRRNR